MHIAGTVLIILSLFLGTEASKDLLGRDRAEMEPVSQPNNCWALINADGVIEGFGSA